MGLMRGDCINSGATRLPFLVSADRAVDDAKEPWPNGARGFVVIQAAVDHHENVMRQIFNIAVGGAEIAQQSIDEGKLITIHSF